jgi:hypothetical protein
MWAPGVTALPHEMAVKVGLKKITSIVADKGINVPRKGYCRLVIRKDLAGILEMDLPRPKDIAQIRGTSQ